jgi:hypothetical protein
MKLVFADGKTIETPNKGSIVEFLFRNHPEYLAEYCAYIDRNNSAFRYIDWIGKYAL